MTPLMNNQMKVFSLVCAVLWTSQFKVHAQDFESLTTQDGSIVEFMVTVPPEYVIGSQAPVLLALPPGPQTKSAVSQGVNDYWSEEAGRRGWVVVSPAAVQGQLYFQGAERVIPELLDHIVDRFSPAGDKVHLAGISNGGLSAFHIALQHPDRFTASLSTRAFHLRSKPGAILRSYAICVSLCMWVRTIQHGKTAWTGSRTHSIKWASACTTKFCPTSDTFCDR